MTSPDPSLGSPTGDSVFRIGSITKVFTTLLMLQLRDQGLLKSTSEDITTYLPEFKIQNPYQTKRGVTFWQLSSHMGGLPRETPCDNIFFHGCNLTDDQVYANLSKMELILPPGSVPNYSNLGFALLGHALERVSGTGWEESVQEMILDPLGMTRSGSVFTPEILKDLAVGYFANGSVASRSIS